MHTHAHIDIHLPTRALFLLLKYRFSSCAFSLFQTTNYGFSQSALEMVPMGKWVLCHELFTLLLQLTVICSSLVDALVVEGVPLSRTFF